MSLSKVCIIDYGAGNTGSVVSALRYLGVDATIVGRAEDVAVFDKIVLPGVGSFKKAMANLNEKGLVQEIRSEVLIMKKPILGICLGFQMLFTSSTEESLTDGLGLISGKIVHLKMITGKNHKIPHIGFNQIDLRSRHPLFKDIKNASDFYFVHSFGLDTREGQLSSFCTTEYGGSFISAVAEENIMGTQFHPEKSQSNGLALLKNFLDY